MNVRSAVVILACLYAQVCQGSDLDEFCKPRGWIQQISSWWNPKNFWAAQLPAIRKEVDFSIKGSQLRLLQMKTDDAIEQKEQEKRVIQKEADREGLRILGVKTVEDRPNVRKAMDDVDRAIAKSNQYVEDVKRRLIESEAQGVKKKMLWGERCTAYVHQQIPLLEQGK